jgi:hypothetical protein
MTSGAGPGSVRTTTVAALAGTRRGGSEEPEISGPATGATVPGKVPLEYVGPSTRARGPTRRSVSESPVNAVPSQRDSGSAWRLSRLAGKRSDSESESGAGTRTPRPKSGRGKVVTARRYRY